MQITIPRAALLRELTALSEVVDKKETMPILSHLLVRASDGSATFSATNLMVGLTVRLELQVAAPGQMVIPAHALSMLARSLSDAEITVTADASRACISAGATKASFPLLPAEDFPDCPHAPAPLFSVASRAIQGMVRETRYAMNGTSAKANTCEKEHPSDCEACAERDKIGPAYERLAALDAARALLRAELDTSAAPETVKPQHALGVSVG